MSPGRTAVRPAFPFEALDDLLRFGGAEGFTLPARFGAGPAPDPAVNALLDVLLACIADDATGARRALAGLPADDALLHQAWWAGASAFLSARLAALGLGAELGIERRRLLLAEELACRRRHAHALAHVPALLARLEGAGLRPVLLKGLTLAHRIYPEPWVRPSGDVDVLLRDDEAHRARELLLADGLVEAPNAGGHASESHRHLQPLSARVGEFSLVVELHTGVVEGGAPERMATEALVARSVRLPLGATRVRALSVDDGSAHLALHHSGEPSWRRMLDALLLARRLGPGALGRARPLLERADRWRLDLFALLAADALDAACAGAVPPWRRALLGTVLAPGWSRAHLAALARGDDTATAAGLVARALGAARDRQREILQALLPVAGREPVRRARAAARLLRDLARAAGAGLRERRRP